MSVAAALVVLAALLRPQLVGRPEEPIGQPLATDPAGPGEWSSCSPSIAATARRLHVVWQDARDGEWAVRYRRGDLHGAAWDDPDVRLSRPGTHALDPRVVASDGCVHVAWRTLAGIGSDPDEFIGVASSLDDGTSWTEAVALRPSGGGKSDYVSAPDLAATRRGGACVAWIQAIDAVDRALVAVREGRGGGWPASPVPFAPAEDGTRAAWARVAACAPTPSEGERIVVARAEIPAGAQARIVVSSSADGGATFPESLGRVLWRGDLLSAPRLGTNGRPAIHLIWPALGDDGRPCLLAQRSLASGAPASWLDRPLRVDDPSTPIASFQDVRVAVDSRGDAVAVYAVERAAGAQAGFPRIDVLANTFPAGARSDGAWSNERVVSDPARRESTSLVRVRPCVAAFAAADRSIAAIAWTEDPATNGDAARLWWSATIDGGASWTTRPLDAGAGADAPRADSTSLLLRRDARGAARAALVWDDRRFFTPPAAEDWRGRGAPETCFLEIELPCSPASSR